MAPTNAMHTSAVELAVEHLTTARKAVGYIRVSGRNPG